MSLASERPTNPYIAGAPLRKEKGFFGRQDILEWVPRELHNTNTNALVLFGQRRIGKTSLLLRLQRLLPAAEFLPVFFDLQDQAASPLSEVLADLAEAIATVANIEPPERHAFDDRGDYFILSFLPTLYKALGERRPVLLMDEADVLDLPDAEIENSTAAAKTFFPFLRRLMIADQKLVMVFVVGRRTEDMTMNFMATFKTSLSKEVWTLDQTSTAGLVRQAEANNTLRFSDAAVTRIWTITSGHPYLTQLLCQRLWEKHYRAGQPEPRVLDEDDVNDIIPDALEAGKNPLSWLWDGLSPAEKIYAAALAEVGEEGVLIPEDQVVQILGNAAARLRRREVEDAPRDLVRRHVLEVEEGRPREYRFGVELLRRWVRQHKPLREVKDELDQVDPLAEQYYKTGNEWLRRRKWVQAVDEFRNALEANPQHLRARLGLGEAQLELGLAMEAVKELAQAYELDRDEARLPYARALVAQAKILEADHQDDAALKIGEQALTLSPNEQAAKELRAGIFTRRGDVALAGNHFDEALANYRKAENTGKTAQVEEAVRRRTLVLQTQAEAHVTAGEWAKAAEVYQQLQGLAPAEEARAQWQAALEKYSTEADLETLFDTGWARLKNREWDKARQAFEDVVRRRPDYARHGQLASGLLFQAQSRKTGDTDWRGFSSVAMGVAAIGIVVLLGLLGWAVVFGPDLAPTSVANLTLPPATTAAPQATKPAATTPAPLATTALPPAGTTLAPVATTFGAVATTAVPGASPTATDTPTETLPPPSPSVNWAEVTPEVEQTIKTSGGAPVWSAALSPDGTRLALGIFNFIKLWQVADATELGYWTDPGTVRSVAFSPDGQWLASGSSDRNVRVVASDAVADSSETLSASPHGGQVRSVVFSADGAWLASGSGDGTVGIWETQKFTRQVTLRHGGQVNSVAFAPDNIHLISGGTDKRVLLWEVTQTDPIKTVATFNAVVQAVAIAPQGEWAAVATDVNPSGSWTVRLIHLISGESRTLGVTGSITALAFSPDGQFLVTGSAEGQLRLWRVPDGTFVYSFSAQSKAITSVAFSLNGDTIISASEDSTVKVWRAEP